MILNTIIYEGNYKRIINPDSWFLRYKNPMITKFFTVNNVKDRKDIELFLNKYKEEYDFDYYFVEDYKDRALEFLEVDINENYTIGYNYIIPYLTLAFIVKAEDYVLHFQEDCINNLNFTNDFLIESIKEIECDSPIISTTLSWESNSNVGELEHYNNTSEEILSSYYPSENFWFSSGFSDQCFLTSGKILKEIQYEYSEYLNKKLPEHSYCPYSFEKRVAEYFYRRNLCRGILKNNNEYYIHG